MLELVACTWNGEWATTMSERRIIAGRYEIVHELGEGGMGTVYLGIDRNSGQQVAIKSLKADVVKSNPEIVERFDREGEALRKLNHPNIVKMFGSVTDDGEHYLIMEYVSGGSLRELMLEGPMPIHDVLEISLDLCDALTRAHRLKIIHRDLKPANVLIAADGTPRLTDFGIAHMGDAPGLTRTGAIMGTLAYISPEAVAGEELDVRADIWAFGVMLYEMLAGQRPFEADNTAALLSAIISKPPPDLLQFRDDVPISLMGLIIWMLEKDRNQRVGSVRMVGAQIEALLTGSDEALGVFLDPSTGQYGSTPPTGTQMDSLQALRADIDDPDVTGRLPEAPVPEMRTHDFALADDDALTTPGSQLNVTASPSPDTAEIHRGWEKVPRRQIDHPPRVFISYRRDDSAAITGRLYDRLSDAFGDDNIFKDVDKIPAGVNFKHVLDQHVAACDVLLVIMGRKWATVTDGDNKQRLSDPNDFVHIEVKAGIDRDDVLVIPVLVDNATMPPLDALPKTLHNLAYYNAATVRNDPDFNRDVQWLVEQINSSFDVVIPRKLNPMWVGGAAVALIAALFLLVFGLIPALTGAPEATDTPAPQQESTAVSAVTEATPTPEPLPPPEAGTYRVLVAQFVPLDDTQQDVQRFIADDLTLRFEEEVPFSLLRVATYPGIIENEEQALAVAEANTAAVIIWGDYDSEVITANINVGTLDMYPRVVFSRDDIEQLVNVRVRLTNPRTQSLALNVLTVFQVTFPAADDTLSFSINTATGAQLRVTGGEVVGNNLAARWHRLVSSYLAGDYDTALTEANGVTSLFPQVPLAWSGRGLIRQALGENELAIEDYQTAQSRGPSNWASPYVALGHSALYLQNDPAAALPLYMAAIELSDNDPMLYISRGAVYYLQGDFELARADIERAIELNPPVNFPYLFIVGLALRDGNLVEAQRWFNFVGENFPDPAASQRMMEAVYGSTGTENFIGPMMSAFGNLTLGQWRTVIADTDRALEIDVILPEIYFMRGLAYCNIGDDENAEAAYTAGIEADPDYILLYMMRAEVRRNQRNVIGAGADLVVVTQSDLAEQFAPVMLAAADGVVDCTNIFSVDLETIIAEYGG